MIVAIDPRSPLPPFEQLRVQVAAQATDGSLPAGTRLPTVRRLAADLGIAPGTVARAYRELESDGVIETRGRHGTFVRVPGDESARLAATAARDFAERMRRLGLDAEGAVRLVRNAFETTGASSG